jgi:hypothetical protein
MEKLTLGARIHLNTRRHKQAMSSFVSRFLPALQHFQASSEIAAATKKSSAPLEDTGAKAPVMPLVQHPTTYDKFMKDIMETTVATAV